jgi:hypothetical protein
LRIHPQSLDSVAVADKRCVEISPTHDDRQRGNF